MPKSLAEKRNQIRLGKFTLQLRERPASPSPIRLSQNFSPPPAGFFLGYTHQGQTTGSARAGPMKGEYWGTVRDCQLRFDDFL
jgi:hypothetical protein